MNVLLMMDPFIRVPPAHYGGIERVVADLAAGLSKNGHHVTLWAAPGSQVEGASNRSAGKASGRAGATSEHGDGQDAISSRRERFDVVHNFGRLAYLAPILSRDVAKVQTYMRTVNPANMVRARRLGARRLHYTAVSAAIRDTGRSGRRRLVRHLQLRRAGPLSIRRRHRPGRAHRSSSSAVSIAARAPTTR